MKVEHKEFKTLGESSGTQENHLKLRMIKADPNKTKTEIWKVWPRTPFIEGNLFGEVRTRDRNVPVKQGYRLIKGRILKQFRNRCGYLYVSFRVNGKRVNRTVHRIIAECFIPNPNNLPEVNHLDNNPENNAPSNLEWCTHEYNIEYREKYGTPAKDFVLKSPVYAINLKNLKAYWFESQREAGRVLGVDYKHISRALKGRYKTVHGYWFVKDDGKIDKNELQKTAAGIQYKNSIYAVNLKTLRVSWFESQRKAGRELGISPRNISSVIKGRCNQTGSYWFVNDNKNTVEKTRARLGNTVSAKVEVLMAKNNVERT